MRSLKVFERKKDIAMVAPLYVLTTFLKATGRYDDFLNKREDCLKKCLLSSGARFFTSVSAVFCVLYGKNDGYELFYFFLRDNFYNFNSIETSYIKVMTNY